MAESKEIKEPPLDLTEDQKKAVAELRTKIPADAKLRDAILARWLYQNWYNVDTTAKVLNEHLVWRKENKIDDFLSRDLKKSDIIKRLIPYSYHGFDVEGRPVYWEKTGQIHAQALMKQITYEEYLDSHIYGFEFLTKRMEEQSTKLGTRVDTICAVFDLEGVGFHHRSAIGWISSLFTFDQVHYPGIVGRVIILNSPWMFPMFFNMIKGFLGVAIQNRIQILSDAKTELPALIPKAHIPPEYGGECKSCEGGCMKLGDISDLLTVAEDEGLELKNVAAGSTFTKELKAEKGSIATWYFVSEGNYDIDFSARIVFADAKKAPVMAKQPTRCTTAKGSYTAEEACTLVFVWDNSYSWLNSKNIKFYVSVVSEKPEDKAKA